MPREQMAAPHPPAPGTRNANPATTPLLIAVALLVALRLVVLFAPSGWLWGFDVWRLQAPATVAALVTIALLGLVPPIARGLGAVLTWLGDRWSRAGSPLDLLFAVAAGVALDIARDPLRFPGDSALRLSMIEKPTVSQPLLAQAFPLDRWINVELPRWLMNYGMTAEQALQLVSAIMGALFVFAGLRFIRACDARGGSLVGAALVLLGGALPVHFVGYDKFGPLMLGLVLMAAGVTRLARRGSGAVTLALGGVIAALSHRSSLLLLPAIAWTFVRAFATAPGRAPRAMLGVAAAAIAGAFAVVLPRAIGIVLSYDTQVHLPGGTVEATRMHSGLPSLALHVADGINALSLLVPLALLGSACAWTVVRKPAVPPAEARFSLLPPALLALAAAAALLLAVEPGGGWPRDWDVATGAGTLVACVSVGGLVRIWSDPAARASLGSAFALGVAVLVGTWMSFLDPAATLQRARELAESASLRTGAIRTQTFHMLATWEYDDGKYAEAAKLFDQAIECGGPNPRLLFEAGLSYVLVPQPDSAWVRFRHAVELDPSRAGAWSGLASIAFDAGRIDEASALVDTALALQPDLYSARFIRDRIREARSGGH